MMCLLRLLSIVDPCQTAAPPPAEVLIAAIVVAASLSRCHPQTSSRRNRENSLLSRQRDGDASCTCTSPVTRVTRNGGQFPPREVFICPLLDIASPLIVSRCARWSPASSRRPPSATRCLSRSSFCSVAASRCFSLRRIHINRRLCGLMR